MFRKGLSFTVCLFVVFVSVASEAVAQTPQECYARGMQAACQGKYQQAIQELQRAVTVQPDYAKAHAALSTIYLQLSDFPASEKALSKQETSHRHVRSEVATVISHNESLPSISIGDYEQADSIEMQWQSGVKQLIKSVLANQVLSLEEGKNE